MDYTIPIFSLAGGGGFPAEFDIYWRSNRNSRISNTADPLGARASHSFSFFLWKGIDASGVERARVGLEGGDIQAFSWDASTSTWTSEHGQHASLVALAPLASCGAADKAIVTTSAGDRYQFRDWCDATSPLQGTIERIDRPNGDFLTFAVSNDGLITRVTDRLGATVALAYDGPALPPAVAKWGLLQSVTAPDGSVFSMSRKANAPAERVINSPAGILYTLEIDPATNALMAVLDGNGNIDQKWTYDPTGTLVTSEAGPGDPSRPGNNNTVVIGGGIDSATLTFTPAGSSSTVTNTYRYGATSGALPHVTDRDVRGACPNCGSSHDVRKYWSGTNNLYAMQDGNGFVTVYQSYDVSGNPLIIDEACSGTVDSPNCTGARRTTYTYRTGTHTIASVSRPSVMAGRDVSETRVFDSGSSRILVDRREGYTASSIAGSLDSAPRTRTTAFTYGGGAGGVEVTCVEGPFDDSGSGVAPADAPRTDYSWYAPGAQDLLTGGTVPGDANRLASIARAVDGSRGLTTRYGGYDGAGRPSLIESPDGARTTLTYDFRGQVTRTVVDAGGLSLQTDSEYDPNGNLIAIRLPATSSRGRTGVSYRYDDADRVTDVLQGYFTGASFRPIESMHYDYDAWGNRLRSESRDAAGVAVTSESSTYDAFNRLVELARPAGDAKRKTRFGYDPTGNLDVVTDAQNDAVQYGSLEDPSRYDRFGKLTLVRQQVCDHPAADPDAPCTSSRLADVRYTYDPALQLKEVQVDDAVRGGIVRTQYLTDDFGEVVRVDSPDSGATSYRYDGAGRLVESLDAREKNFRYQYDRLGRLTAKTNASPVGVTAGPPGHGTTAVNPDGTVTYSPATGFYGTDGYAYTVTGRNGETTTSAVSVSVDGLPAAKNAALPVVRGTPLTIFLRATDPDDCDLTFSLLNTPSLGALSAITPLPCTPGAPNADAASVTYTATVTGFDTFTFQVQDAAGARSTATISLVVTASGAAMLGVSTATSASGGLDASDSKTDGNCTVDPCVLTSDVSSRGPASSSEGFARASRGSLAAAAIGTGGASFASRGNSFFTLTDLVFPSTTGSTVCSAGMNLILNGTLDFLAAAAAGAANSQVALHVDIGGNVFNGTLVADGTGLLGTGLLAGLTSTSNVALKTPGFCVPANANVLLTLSLTASVSAVLSAGESASLLSDFSNTLSFPPTGVVFDLPPGGTADSPGGGIVDNHWIEAQVPVTIDVKPGSPVNPINCTGSANKVIPVAILSQRFFDARSVDADSVRFEGAAETHRDRQTGMAMRHEEDVDGDGVLDLVFHFRYGDTSLTCSSTRVRLTGLDLSGATIEGFDVVKMVPIGGAP